MIELAVDCRCELGEGPIWDDRAGQLLFVDINGHAVHVFNPATGAHDAHDTGEYVSAVALAAGGAYLIARQHDVARWSPAAGVGERVARVEAERADTRFNDGCVDTRGRLWLGSMSLVKEKSQGSLYRFDAGEADGARVIPMLEHVTTSNGIDWSPDDRLMYYVDTGTRRIDVFDFEATSGSIANRRTFVAIPESEGKPDGLIVDADGCIWVALWQGSAIRRYAPDGRLVQQVDLPVSCPTKCAFGGDALDTIFVTSARTALSPSDREREPHAGSVFAVHAGVRGRLANQFGNAT